MKKSSDPLNRASPRSAVRTILRRCRPITAVTSINTILLGSMVAYGQSATAPASPTASPAPISELKEIVVTAQRRKQTVQDVPYNISVIDPRQIEQSGATTLNDLTRDVPGLVTVDTGPGSRGGMNNLTLRGLRTDSPGGGQSVAEIPGESVSPVSTYFGETPVFFAMPLYDVQRVEVLRGPQGTLYGSGSQAGTIRIIPNPPEFDHFSGEVEGTASDTDHASSSIDNLNRDIEGYLNIPLAARLALRIDAGREHDGGFINNVDLFEREGPALLATPTPSEPGVLTSGPVIAPEQRDTNTTDQWFARSALRWQPTDAVELQLNYVHQFIKSANGQYSDPGYSGGVLNLTTASPVPPSASNPAAWPNSSFTLNPTGPYDSTAFTLSPYNDKIDLGSAVATVDFGFASLTSASSYYTHDSFAAADYTPAFFSNAGFNFNVYPPYNFYPRMLPITEVPTNDHSFIQELRLVSDGRNRFDYVVGGYYQREGGSVQFHQYIPGLIEYLDYSGQPNPASSDQDWHYLRDTTFKDLAGFGELTWHITRKWQLTAGLRVFHQTFDTQSSSHFFICGSICSADLTNPEGYSASLSSFGTTRVVKKVNTAYDFSPNFKVYATYSEGFRRGGANALPLAGIYATLPTYQTFSPDFAKNYEVGIKGRSPDHRLQYSADIYRIDVTSFQFDGEDFSYFPATYNGKGSRSQGGELAVTASLTQNTQATFSYGYTQAKVTQTFELLDYPTYSTIPSLGGTGATAPLFNGPITAGTRLPGVPLTTVSFGLDHTVPLPMIGSGGGALQLHVDGAYRSATSATILASTPFNWTIPSSFSGDARATLITGGPVSYSLFVNNFTDCLCYSGGQNIQSYANYSRDRYIARPRTIGITLRYDF
ncbi:MAG TPA: TonB-dependent receptor [Steroidobacteraceae bacterium]|nr:TonB-dependent receptor [Steroidobacteraceae bacterium]